MPIRLDRKPNEPILIATMSGDVTREEIQHMFQKSAELAAEIEESVLYRITDMRSAETSFPELLRILQSLAPGQPGSSSDPRFKPVLVGQNHWTKFAADALRQQQFGGVELPIFNSLAEALHYIQVDRNRRRDGIA